MSVDIYNEFFSRIGVIIDWNEIDDIVVNDSNILRPVKGHAFEYIFDEDIHQNFDYQLLSGVGDSEMTKNINTNKLLKQIIDYKEII